MLGKYLSRIRPNSAFWSEVVLDLLGDHLFVNIETWYPVPVLVTKRLSVHIWVGLGLLAAACGVSGKVEHTPLKT